MKKFFILACFACAGASQAVIVFDSVGSSTTSSLITSGSSPRTSYGFNVNTTGGGLLAGLNVGFAVTTGITAVDIRVSFWATTNWAATGTNPALSGLIGRATLGITGLPGTSGGFTTGLADVSGAGIVLPNGNVGVSFEFFTSGTTTFIPANGATIIFQSGAPLVGTQVDGFIRDGATTGTPSGVYNGQDWRNFGAPNNHAVAMMQLDVVPEPATMAALGLGTLALLRRRRK